MAFLVGGPSSVSLLIASRGVAFVSARKMAPASSASDAVALLRGQHLVSRVLLTLPLPHLQVVKCMEFL